jgi:hypothetical protein
VEAKLFNWVSKAPAADIAPSSCLRMVLTGLGLEFGDRGKTIARIVKTNKNYNNKINSVDTRRKKRRHDSSKAAQADDRIGWCRQAEPS